MKKLAILCSFVLFASGAALASESDRLVGDVEAGQAKAAVCAACHGQTGNSIVGDFPSIAGQGKKYLVKQLKDYQLGNETSGQRGRYHMLMADQVRYLSDQDIYDLSAFYAAQVHEIGETPEEVIEEGRRLWLGGDVNRGITACAACHGPSGLGMSLATFPLLSGQHPEYTQAQLEAFRSGERANDPNGMMRDIAVKLTDRDIQVLSQFIRGLH